MVLGLGPKAVGGVRRIVSRHPASFETFQKGILKKHSSGLY